MGFDDFDAQLQSEDLYPEGEYSFDDLDLDLIRDGNEEPPPGFFDVDDEYLF